MLRNGLTVARRPIGTQIAGAAYELPHNHLPFVCNLCRACSPTSTSKSTSTTTTTTTTTTIRHSSSASKYNPYASAKKKKIVPMSEQVKQLEAHVQLMERNYVERLRAEAAKKEIPTGDVTEEEKDKIYAELMAPLHHDAVFLPAPADPTKYLPAVVRKRLGTGLELVKNSTPQWDLILTALEEAGGLKDLTVNDANKMLSCIPGPQRAQLTNRIFTMMETAGVEPNTFTYDLAMVAHAAMHNTVEVKLLFKKLVETGLSPTVYSYGHLLKAYARERDVAAASAAFQDMQRAGIEPNLVVYTTLIQTCVNRHELDTAWQIFNLIKFKSAATAPDVSTYSLMIHACALNGETERAMDLFTDMTVRRGIEPNQEVYHSIIHACAVRKDYFATAWEYAVKMQREGMELNRRVLNVLVQACGRSGELTRARLLVRHMQNAGRDDLMPDMYTYQNLMRAYATYVPPRTAGKRSPKKGVTLKTLESDSDVFLRPAGEVAAKSKPAIDRIPFVEKAVLGTPREVLDEAAVVINWLRETKPHIVDTQLMNAFLDICVCQESLSDTVQCYTYDFENPINPFLEANAGRRPAQPKAPETEEEAEHAALLASVELPRMKRNIHTFKVAMSGAAAFRDLPLAKKVWADRMEFVKTPEYWKEPRAVRQKLDFEAEKDMFNVLALCGHIGEAQKRIRILTEDAAMKWSWDDLKTVYTKAVEAEDPETMGYIRKLTGRDGSQR